MADEDKKVVEQDTPAEDQPTQEKVDETPTENNPTETTEVNPEESATATSPEITETVEEVKPEESYQKILPGMVVRVHLKIKDVTPRGDERERIQVFEGTVIAKKGKDRISSTITVRKISNGVGVERIFPLAMPTIDRIEVVKQLRVRRSKLYFLRNKFFKKRLKEVKVQGK